MKLSNNNSHNEEEYACLNKECRKEYNDVFNSKLPFKLPPKGGPTHWIRLKDDKKPMNERLLCVPTKYFSAMQKFIQDNVRKGRLRPSLSSIASGIFMISKKGPDTSPRVVHDYHTLYDNTIKDHTPLPR